MTYFNINELSASPLLFMTILGNAFPLYSFPIQILILKVHGSLFGLPDTINSATSLKF